MSMTAVTKAIKKSHPICSTSNWSIDNNLKLNVNKTKELNISTSRVPHWLPALTIGDETLEVVHTVKLLGVHLSSDLKWSTHINNVYGQRRVSDST